MRIAPIGIIYGAGDVKQLREHVETAVYCTHVHPLGIDGAVCQARAIGTIAQYSSDTDKLSPHIVLRAIHEALRTDEFHRALDSIEELLQNAEVTVDQVITHLGHGIEAIKAVPTALYAFLSHSHSFEEAVVYAVGLGGDTDTIGAMAGALSGAYLGASQIPARWLEALEEGKHGKSYIDQLAHELFHTFIS
jgi:poly(ADP-ribose) glycohydrolase ARH3